MEADLMRRKTKDDHQFKFIDLITIFAFLSLTTYFVYQTARSVDLTRQKLDIFDKAKEEVSDLRIKNVKLILMSERVETEEYIEEEARNRLNYAKDGETLFIIPEDLLFDPELDEYVNTFSFGYVDQTAVNQSNYDIWKEFFFEGI